MISSERRDSIAKMSNWIITHQDAWESICNSRYDGIDRQDFIMLSAVLLDQELYEMIPVLFTAHQEEAFTEEILEELHMIRLHYTVDDVVDTIERLRDFIIKTLDE